MGCGCNKSTASEWVIDLDGQNIGPFASEIEARATNIRSYDGRGAVKPK